MKKPFYKKIFFIPLVLALTFSFSLLYTYAEVDVSVEQAITGQDFASIYFFDTENEEEIDPPKVEFDDVDFAFFPQTSEGTLATDDTILRVDNPRGDVDYDMHYSLDLSIAPAGENGWVDSETNNEYAIDEGDSHLEVDLSDIDIEEVDDCGNINYGSSASFEGNESVDILGVSEAGTCRLNVQNILFEQTIPEAQPTGIYSLDMVLTLVQGMEPADYSCYEQQGDYTGPIHLDNRYYFKYSDSSETGTLDGCPTPEDLTEVNDIWEWYETGENLGEYIARDNWSGLLWTAPLDCDEVDGYGGDDHWENSKNLCAGLGEEYTKASEDSESGGHTDWEFEDRDYEWRLPTKNELKQISPYDHNYGPNGYYNEGSGHGMKEWSEDSSMGDNPDFVDSRAGESDNPDRYWSQNLQADNTSRAFLVRPSNGRVYNYLRAFTTTSYSCVRCVAEDRK